jgi:hypothetical protein
MNIETVTLSATIATWIRVLYRIVGQSFTRSTRANGRTLYVEQCGVGRE